MSRLLHRPLRSWLAYACVLGGALLMPPLLLSCGDGPTPGPPAGTPSPAAPYDSDGRRLETSAPPQRLPNLVLFVLDTLRRDAVSLQAGEPGVMPFYASLGREGVAFLEASAPAPWTIPSVTSLLTGLLPHEHGCNKPVERATLSPAITTYAEILRAGYGYETAVFSGSPWFPPSADTIFQGLERPDVGAGFGLAHTARALDHWLATRDASRPFFLVLHTFEPHDPYGEANHTRDDVRTPEERHALAQAVQDFDVRAAREPWELTRVFLLDTIGRRALQAAQGRSFTEIVLSYCWDGFAREPRPALAQELREAYVQGARWVDGLLLQSVEALTTRGLLEDTVLVVTSDHGEAFGEHGVLGHGKDLHDELLRVPLVITGPGPFAARAPVTASVGLIDVLPTFLDYAGLTPLPGTAGRSLLPLLAGEAEGHAVIAEEEVGLGNARIGVRRLRTSVRDERWKYLADYDIVADVFTETVYDLRLDPEERKDLALTLAGQEPPWGAGFCEALRQARTRLWDARILHVRAGEALAANGMAKPLPARPEGCAVLSR